MDRLGDEDIQGRLRIDEASMACGMAWGMGLDSCGLVSWGTGKNGDLNFEVSLFRWYPGKSRLECRKTTCQESSREKFCVSVNSTHSELYTFHLAMFGTLEGHVLAEGKQVVCRFTGGQGLHQIFLAGDR